MSESDDLKNLPDALAESAKKQVDSKAEDDTKKSARVEEKDTLKGDPVGKAKEEVGLALWEGIRKAAPYIVLFVWIVASVVLLVVVLSFLVLGIAYICHLLGWVTLARVGEVKLFLANVFTFPSGVASAALVFYLNRKPRQ